MSKETNMASSVKALARPGGSVAYEVAGAGPLVVCVPGIGELRSSYRFVAPMLVAAGYRVALADLRGHGDSDAGFDSYGDDVTAGDIAALLEELGGPGIIVGNSMAAGSAVLVAASRPDLVAGLVLVGPFVRDPANRAFEILLFKIMMNPVWARPAWNLYLPKLYAGHKPDDFTEYRGQVKAAMKKRGHTKAFSLTARTLHAAPAAALGAVRTPTLVIMGELDPDFKQPAVEAGWIAERLGGSVLMVADAGHYPQAQRPELVGPAIQAFANAVHRHA